MRRFLLSLLLTVSLAGSCLAGASRDFDGTNDELTAARSNLTSTFTLTAWVNSDTFALTQSIIIGNLIGSPTFAHNYFFQIEDSGQLACGIYNGTLYPKADEGAVSMLTGTWYYVACTYDSAASSGTLTIYIDESQVGQTTGTGTSSPNADTVFSIGSNSAQASSYLDGKLAYVHVYNKVLTTAEMSQTHWKPFSIADACEQAYGIWGVNSPEPDLCANGRNATVTEAAESALGPPVMLGSPTAWHRLWKRLTDFLITPRLCR